ncbi:MAG: hypothetical protein GC137_09100 [Alphaproteobacteria bacterium]|nr:hypothetical protein [Alphaproteobacteria bacterium]
MIFKKHILLCLLIVPFLVSCDHTGGEPVSINSYAHIKPELIRVSSYEVVPFEPGTQNIKPENFAFFPERAIERFFKNRFEPAAVRGAFRVIIQNVTVDHRIVQSDNVINKTLDLGKQDHYLIRARVRLEVIDGPRIVDGSVTLNAQQNVYISEHSSITEREAVQVEAIEALIDDLDRAVVKVLNENFFLF